jgi:hypothetical protein
MDMPQRDLHRIVLIFFQSSRLGTMSSRDGSTGNVESASALTAVKEGPEPCSTTKDNTFVYDELRQVERDVVQGERRLAEQEKLVLELKREGNDTAAAEGELEILRKNQRVHDQNRQRLLSRLQP